MNPGETVTNAKVSTGDTPPAVQVRSLTKFYGRVKALDSVDLSIAGGEYFVLLGPSGGGKTTLLRLIGGFIRPSSGSVALQGVDVTGQPPDKRPTSMVFQNYALFPHMTVAKNVGYGLKLRKVDPDQAASEVRNALELVSLTGFEERRPWELSGGQQQRVQLARALVLKPRILLLDEPLAALDAKLRKDMCYELKHLQESVGITFIHVTHNQEEAMAVADQIALIANGKLVEQGTTRQVYEQPRDRFTADFIGERNVFEATVTQREAGMLRVNLGFAEFQMPVSGSLVTESGQIAASIRTESIQVHTQPSGAQDMLIVPAIIQEQIYLGLTTRITAKLENGLQVVARTINSATQTLEPGDKVYLHWAHAQMSLHHL